MTGVSVYRDVNLTGLKEEEGTLQGVELTPVDVGEMVSIPCSTLITLQDKVIDSHTFEGTIFISSIYNFSINI